MNNEQVHVSSTPFRGLPWESPYCDGPWRVTMPALKPYPPSNNVKVHLVPYLFPTSLRSGCSLRSMLTYKSRIPYYLTSSPRSSICSLVPVGKHTLVKQPDAWRPDLRNKRCMHQATHPQVNLTIAEQCLKQSLPHQVRRSLCAGPCLKLP